MSLLRIMEEMQLAQGIMLLLEEIVLRHMYAISLRQNGQRRPTLVTPSRIRSTNSNKTNSTPSRTKNDKKSPSSRRKRISRRRNGTMRQQSNRLNNVTSNRPNSYTR